MEKINFAEIILDKYKNGQRYFSDYDLENEDFDDQNLADIIFNNCFISSSFKRANLRNAKLIHSNIKTSDFSYADLSNAHFEHLMIDATNFIGAKMIGFYFEHNYFQGEIISKINFFQTLKNEDK